MTVSKKRWVRSSASSGLRVMAAIEGADGREYRSANRSAPCRRGAVRKLPRGDPGVRGMAGDWIHYSFPYFGFNGRRRQYGATWIQA